ARATQTTGDVRDLAAADGYRPALSQEGQRPGAGRPHQEVATGTAEIINGDEPACKIHPETFRWAPMNHELRRMGLARRHVAEAKVIERVAQPGLQLRQHRVQQARRAAL